MQSKTMFALSLTRKAGALITGFDSVKESVLNKKAYLIVFAADISPATKKRMLNVNSYNIKHFTINTTQQEFAQITKKPVGVMAVCDKQLAQLCQKALLAENYICGNNKEEYNGN